MAARIFSKLIRRKNSARLRSVRWKNTRPTEQPLLAQAACQVTRHSRKVFTIAWSKNLAARRWKISGSILKTAMEIALTLRKTVTRPRLREKLGKDWRWEVARR